MPYHRNGIKEHMDEEGHKALAEAVLEKISEIL